MIIRRLEIAGFCGARKALVFEFTRGFVVVNGRNGSGKTTICDAIEFALTGKLSRQLWETEKGEYGSDYIWTRGGTTPTERKVGLTLEKDDGSELRIVRTVGGRLAEPGESFVGQLVNMAEAPNHSAEDVSGTSIIRDETISDLSVDLSETARFDFVNRALGSVDTARANKILNGTVEKCESRLRESRIRYDEIRRGIEDWTERLSQARASIQQAEEVRLAESRLVLVNNKVTGVQDSLESAGQYLASMHQRITALEGLLVAVRQFKIREAKTNIAETRQRLTLLTDRNAELKRKVGENQRVSAELRARLNEIQTLQPRALSIAQLHEHGKLVGLIDGRCPLCSSTVESSAFDAHLNTMREWVDSVSAQLNDLLQRSNEAEQLERDTRNELRTAENEHAKLSDELNALESERARMIAECSKYLDQASTTDVPIDPLESEIFRTRTAIASVEHDIGVVRAARETHDISVIEDRLKALKTESLEIERKMNRVRSSLSLLKDSVADLKRITFEVVDERLAELSPLQEELYNRLKPHPLWSKVRYNVRGDVRRFLSFRVGEDLNPKFMFSSGQRRAAGLAFLMAIYLSRTWCRLQTLILDDPVQHIDDFRALHLVEVLAAIRKAGHQVVITVEDSELADLLCRRLRSKPGEEGSVINLEYNLLDGVQIASTRKLSPFPKSVLVSA